MTKKLWPAVIALAACAALALPASAAAKPAKTTVTIHYNGDGWQGKVKSKKPGRCANNREVVVYKQSGGAPHPATDEDLYQDTSSKSGNAYTWNTGNSGQENPGRFYAFAHKITGCKAGISPTVRILP